MSKIYRIQQVELHRAILKIPAKKRTKLQKKRLEELNSLAKKKHGTKNPTKILERIISKAYEERREERRLEQLALIDRYLIAAERAELLLVWIVTELQVAINYPIKVVDKGLYGTATAEVTEEENYVEDLETLVVSKELENIFFLNIPYGYVAGLHLRLNLYNEDSGQSGWVAIEGVSYDPEIFVAGVNRFMNRRDRGDYGELILSVGTYCHYITKELFDRLQRRKKR